MTTTRVWFARDARTGRTYELVGTRDQVRLAAAELFHAKPEHVTLSPAPDWTSGDNAGNYS